MLIRTHTAEELRSSTRMRRPPVRAYNLKFYQRYIYEDVTREAINVVTDCPLSVC
jgi:hypothetical protein